MSISRRKFLRGLGAAAVVTPLVPILTHKAPNLTHKAPNLTHKAPNLTHKRMFIVSSRYDKAIAIHRAMGSPTNVTPAGIGSAICGQQCDLMVLDDFDPTTASDPRTQDWWNQSMETRLTPTAERAVYTQRLHQEFDFGRNFAIPGEWMSLQSGRKRTAMKFDKPSHQLYRTDEIKAAAKHIMHFAKKYHGFQFKFAMILDDPYDMSVRAKARRNLKDWYNSKVDQEVFRSLYHG